MPLNLAENPLSAAKVGSQDLTAAYAGVTQIFPNSTEITSWTGRGATSSYSNTSHSLTTSVTGPAGATFNLIGNNGAVGQTGLTKAVDGAESFSWSISSNDSCEAASRTPTLTLQATGSTTLASPLGGRPNPDTATQAAGPVEVDAYVPMTVSATVQNPGNYVVVGGQRQWLPGTIINASMSSGTGQNFAGGTAGPAGFYFINPGSSGTASNPSGIGTFSPSLGGTWSFSGSDATISAQSNQTWSMTWTSGTQRPSIVVQTRGEAPAVTCGVNGRNSNYVYLYP